MAAHLWVILSICAWLGDILTPQLQVEKTEFCRSFVKHLDKRCAIAFNRSDLFSDDVIVRKFLHSKQLSCPFAEVVIEVFYARCIDNVTVWNGKENIGLLRQLLLFLLIL